MTYIDDIYSYINNMKDNLLYLDIKLEKNIKLDDSEWKEFVNLLFEIDNCIDKLSNFIDKIDLKKGGIKNGIN